MCPPTQRLTRNLSAKIHHVCKIYSIENVKYTVTLQLTSSMKILKNINFKKLDMKIRYSIYFVSPSQVYVPRRSVSPKVRLQDLLHSEGRPDVPPEVEVTLAKRGRHAHLNLHEKT
jgi:hypothetical protein